MTVAHLLPRRNELGVSTNVGWTFDVAATNFFTATRLPANIAKPVSVDSFAPIRGECTLAMLKADPVARPSLKSIR